MSSYILDLDSTKLKGYIKSNNLDLVRDVFSVEDQNAKFTKFKFKSRFIPSRKYAITQTGRYDVGLTLDIIKKINEIDPDCTIQLTEKLKQQVLNNTEVNLSEIISPANYKLRDYQTEVVQTALKRGRGIILIATAGGKTLVMNTLITTLQKFKQCEKIVVITPTQLVKQTYDEFLKFNDGWSCTWWTGENIPNKKSSVIITGNRILLSKKQDIEWLLDADAVLIDEVHGLRQGNEINKVIRKFKTSIKFGFTGTLPEELLDQWNIKGLIGPIIFKRDSNSLRQQDFIAKALVKTVKINYNESPEYIHYKNPYQAEVEFIIKNSFRNNIISKICNKCNNNILILVDRIEHGNQLEDILIKNTSKQVFFIKGDVETADRKKAIEIMEQESNIICIAISSIFSTGINIKNLHYILFAAGGKAKVKIIQSIGRGLRLHKDKNELIIFDIFDNLKYGSKHYEKRKLIYERENIQFEFRVISQ